MSRCALTLVVFFAPVGFASAAEPKLVPEDAKYLDKLIADFLFDPTGAERVTGEFPDARGTGTRSRAGAGWLVRGKDGKGNRVFFTDGDSAPAPDDLIGADFVSACKERYATRPTTETREETDEREQRGAGVNEETDLTLAAWLHKLGHDELAVTALTAARVDAIRHTRFWNVPGPRELLCQQLASAVYSDLTEAYEHRRDEAALEFGTKLFKLYGEVLRPRCYKHLWQVESIVADLHRRKKNDTFGPGAPCLEVTDLPADPTRRVAMLITALEDIQDPPPNHRWPRDAIRDDWRVRELIVIDEPALPALVDAFEKDERRTRSLDHPSVRAALLFAIETIMCVRVVEGISDYEFLCHSDRRDGKVKQAAAQLREHWNTFGKFPFDERMMKVLTDPKSPGPLSAQAADHLADLNYDSNRCWLPQLFGNRVIVRFSNPTVAEAILAARDRYLKALASGKEEPPEDGRENRPCNHLGALVWLGDRRIVPTVAKLADTESDLPLRLKLARTAFKLGEPKPLEAVARELETGALKVRPFVPPTHDPTRARRGNDVGDLATVIRELSGIETPATDRALWALANPNHPHYRATVALLVRYSGEWRDEAGLFRHPYWIGVARYALDDLTFTGRAFKFEDGCVVHSEQGYGANDGLPDELKTHELRREMAVERVCDRLAANSVTHSSELPRFIYSGWIAIPNSPRSRNSSVGTTGGSGHSPVQKSACGGCGRPVSR